MSDLIHNKKELKQLRKDLRKRQTIIEGLIWRHLKNNQIGYKFRRQHSIGNFIVDFYCAQAKLVIELDGSYHAGEAQIEYDKKRTKFLETQNLDVIRYTSHQVLDDLEVVIEDIKRQCVIRSTSPSPSSTEEGNLPKG